jgi:hypothetical protein
MPQSLSGKRLALVVNDTGWRNTTAFDLGIQAMGGINVQPPLRWDTREDLRDLAAYLENWFDARFARAEYTLTAGRFRSCCRLKPTWDACPFAFVTDVFAYEEQLQLRRPSQARRRSANARDESKHCNSVQSNETLLLVHDAE